MNTLKLLALSSAFFLIASCGTPEEEFSTAKSSEEKKTAYCQAKFMDITSCYELRDVSQEVVDAVAESCVSEQEDLEMSSGEGECANRNDAPGVCKVDQEGFLSYYYISGKPITEELARSSCEAEEGSEFIPKA